MRSFLGSLDYESVAALLVLWLLAIGVVAGPDPGDRPDAQAGNVTSEGDPAVD
jgi:hypothetical protein